MIIYNKINGEIIAGIPDNQVPRKFDNIPENDIGKLFVEEYPDDDIFNYYIKDNQLVRYSELELSEIRRYGKLLTDAEREEIKLNLLLQPTGEEIAKAESTLEILSTLQEVGLI